MLLRLHKNPPTALQDSLLRLVEELGYRASFLDRGRQILELTGPGQPGHRSRLEDHAAVLQVLDAGDAPELSERAPGRADTIVRVGAAAFGGGQAALIAGPCAVEDEGRLLEIARAVRSAGAALLRGGVYKPRTSPYSFQGLGRPGLEALARARAETGLGVVSEVLDPRHLEELGEWVDVFQVGSRNMGNGPLLRELGRAGKPVLLKRGMAATAREFLLAAEYVLTGGNDQLILCERGVRGFDAVTRNVLDVGTVAHLKRATHLPVIVDPSHAAGRSDLVRPLARAGLAAGADGLLVEVHPSPGEVRSDGAQALSPAAFAALAADARALLALDGRRLACPDPELDQDPDPALSAARVSP